MKLAVIPARGGSERIPRKNIRNFLGRPIIAYSIAAARDSGLFDRIIVSTDDDEIATVAEDYGAEAPFRRPAHLANDHAGTVAVIQHALAWCALDGHSVSHCCCLYATAPFVTPADLQGAHDLLMSSGKDYVFTVTGFDYPIQRALRLAPGGLELLAPEHAETRSQDLEPTYHDAGQFYWGRSAAFAAGVPLFSHAALPFILPHYRVHDIDTEDDWQRAELMYQALRAGS
jgi:N-acylneuraminate cytidylyltransferase